MIPTEQLNRATDSTRPKFSDLRYWRGFMADVDAELAELKEPTDAELRTIAERYRNQNYPPAGSEWCDHWMPIQEAKDLRTLADAYLAKMDAEESLRYELKW